MAPEVDARPSRRPRACRRRRDRRSPPSDSRRPRPPRSSVPRASSAGGARSTSFPASCRPILCEVRGEARAHRRVPVSASRSVLQLAARLHDGVAPAEESVGSVVPPGAAIEEHPGVPHRVDALRKAAADGVGGAQVAQVSRNHLPAALGSSQRWSTRLSVKTSRGQLHELVVVEHAEPHDEDAQVHAGMRWRAVRSAPTGRRPGTPLKSARGGRWHGRARCWR